MRKNNQTSPKELKKSVAEKKEFFEKNRRDLEKGLIDLCKKYNLLFEPPFSDKEASEIISQARQGEFSALLKAFPNYLTLSETQKMNAKLIQKFGLDAKKFPLNDRTKINEGISLKLRSSSGSSANPELYKFKK